MTIPRLNTLSKFWKDNPPTTVALKRILVYFGLLEVSEQTKENPKRNASGVHSQPKKEADYCTSLASLISDFQGAGGKLQ